MNLGLVILTVIEAFVIAALGLVLIAVLNDGRKQRRGYINRENDLLNRLAHMSGNAWLPPPAEEPEVTVQVPDYLPLPEQEEE